MTLFVVISRSQSFSFIDSVDNVSFVFARHLYNHIAWKRYLQQALFVHFQAVKDGPAEAIFDECLKLAAR